jgi:hypothetical protein
MFDTSRALQPRLTFVDKARSLPKSRALETCFTLVAPIRGAKIREEKWVKLSADIYAHTA